MSDLVIPVQTKDTGNWAFTPDTLFLRIESQDVLSGMAVVYFELFSSVPFDPQKYLTRSWVDKGTIQVPISVIVNASQNGELNTTVLNTILANFNLSILPNNPNPAS